MNKDEEIKIIAANYTQSMQKSLKTLNAQFLYVMAEKVRNRSNLYKFLQLNEQEVETVVDRIDKVMLGPINK